MPMMPPQQTSMPALAHASDGVEPVLIGPRGDDLAVELGRGIEIVVVGGEPSLGEALGLGLRSACRA